MQEWNIWTRVEQDRSHEYGTQEARRRMRLLPTEQHHCSWSERLGCRIASDLSSVVFLLSVPAKNAVTRTISLPGNSVVT
jgi:hypothetical protein